jgi:SAM-dependent methyltransferase
MHSRLGRELWWRTRGRPSELAFWRAWLAGVPGAEEWIPDREERFRADAEVRDSLVRAELSRVAQSDISILDVGAGPVTNLGYRYPGKNLRIVAVDPLADDYDRLLSQAGRRPPIQTIALPGERLLEHFGPGAFDIARAVNSLDHSAEPLSIIENMVGVVRHGGVVLLRHAPNEGETERYEGFHQWNFDVADRRLLLWNNAARIDVTRALADRGDVQATLQDDEVHVRIVVG